MAIKIIEGHLTPHIETVDSPDNLMAFFAQLRHNHPHSLLFESKEVIPRFGNFSIGSNDPALKLWGRGANFEINALNRLGRYLLKMFHNRLNFCDSLELSEDSLRGRLEPRSRSYNRDELARLHRRNHTDILRAVAFAHTPLTVQDYPYGGLFGLFAYDFIDQFEQLPPNAHDPLQLPDWHFYYVDNLFVIDHRINKMHLIANALGIPGVDEDYIRQRCQRKIANYREALQTPQPPPPPNNGAGNISSDTSRDEYQVIVEKMKEHIAQGDVFQIVPSRTITVEQAPPALYVYQRLREINPSPYMFFLDFVDHQLTGSSPELAIRVRGKERKKIEIRPIAGTRPRGLVGNAVDSDLDSRFAVELQTDKKELSEHIMLVDLARNDIAKVAITGSRVVDEPLIIEKYSHVQHLVSNVSGILRPELDAFHAYVATMNMGTVSGAPKIEAMKILRKQEKNKRGYYGGAVAYISPDGDLDSGLIIRSIVFKEQRAYIRAGAGVVYDSIPEEEYRETEHKANACLQAIGDFRHGH